MRKKGKWLFGMALAFTILWSLMLDVAFATEVSSGTCGDNLSWSLTEDGILTISGTGAMDEWVYEREIPWIDERLEINSIIIEEGVASLSEAAFAGFENLTYVSIPASTTNINSRAFYGCHILEGLNVSVDNPAYCTVDGVLYNKDATKMIYCPGGKTQLSISAEVTGFDSYSFMDRFNLKSIDVDEENTLYSSVDGVLYDEKQTKLIICPGAKETVRVPDTVTAIGNSAFYYCLGVKEVTLPEGLTTIGNYTFWSCENLEQIDIPNTVTDIGIEAFAFCFGLKEVELPESITEIPEHSFWNCSGLTSVKLSSNTTVIADGAFDGCSSLGTVDLGSNLTSIGKYVFSACTNLKNIILPDTLTQIGQQAFQACDALTDVYFCGDGYDTWNGISVGEWNEPLSNAKLHFHVDGETEYVAPTCVEEGISAGVCTHCGDTYSVTLPMIDHSYGDDGICIVCGKLEKQSGYCGENAIWSLKEGTLTISGVGEMYDFYYSEEKLPWYGWKDYITEIIIEEGITKIASYAFKDCTKVTDVSIAESVTSIGIFAFSGCTALDSVTIPDGVTEIKTGVFDGCTSLESVVFHENLIAIGRQAFQECDSLEQIRMPSGVKQVGDYAFFACDKLVGVQSIDPSVELQSLSSEDTYVGEYAFAHCVQLEYAVLPEQISAIGNHAFSFCDSLSSIDLPESLTVIDDYAFIYCDNLKEIDIPDTVTDIGTQAFTCGLTSIYIPASVTNLEETTFFQSDLQTAIAACPLISAGAFGNCYELADVALLEGVTSIGEEAFETCTALDTIEMPSTIKTIEGNAFSGCTALRKVIYNGTCAQWADVTVSDGNSELTNALICCTDGWYGVDLSTPPKEDENQMYEIEELAVIQTETAAMNERDYLIFGQNVKLKLCFAEDFLDTPYITKDIDGYASLLGYVALYSPTGEILKFCNSPWLEEGYWYTDIINTKYFGNRIYPGTQLQVVVYGVDASVDNPVPQIIARTTLDTAPYESWLPGSYVPKTQDAMREICKRIYGIPRTLHLYSEPDMGKGLCYGAALCVSAANSSALDVKSVTGHMLLDHAEPEDKLQCTVCFQEVKTVENLLELYYLVQFQPKVAKEEKKNEWNVSGLVKAIDAYKSGNAMMPLVSLSCNDVGHTVAAFDYKVTLDDILYIDVYDPIGTYYEKNLKVTNYNRLDGEYTWELYMFGDGKYGTKNTLTYSVPDLSWVLFDDTRDSAFYGISVLNDTVATFGLEAGCTLVSLSEEELAELETLDGLEVIPIRSISNGSDSGSDNLLAWVSGNGNYTLSTLDNKISLADDNKLYTIESGTSATFQLAEEDQYSVENVSVSGENVSVSCMYVAKEEVLSTVTFEGTPADGKNVELSFQSGENTVQISGAAEGTVKVTYSDEKEETTEDTFTIELENGKDTTIIADGKEAPEADYTSTQLQTPKISVTNVASSGKPKLTWTAVSGADKYEIYRSTSKGGTYTKITTVTGTSYTNTSAVAGKTYYYKVKAIDTDNASANSNLSAAVSLTCDLAKVTGLKVTNVVSSGKPKLTWKAVKSAGKYEIYRATKKSGTYKKLKTTTKTSYTDSSAVAEKTYYYKVKAIYSAKTAANSALSGYVSKVCDLKRPVITVKRNSSGKPKVTWSKISGADKYYVYRAISKNGTYKKIATTKSKYYTNTSVKKGKTYYYKVKAVSTSNSNANSALSTYKSCKAK